MTPVAGVSVLLDHVRADGVELARNGDKLTLRGPVDAIARWKPAIAANKAELLVELATAFRWWLVHGRSSEPLEVASFPDATHAEILERYPDAIAAEPIPPKPAPATRPQPVLNEGSIEMNETLKSLAAAVAAANAELQQRQQAISEASRKRDALADEMAALDAAVEKAEVAHAAALAAIELGEKADSKATAAALEDARRVQTMVPDLRQGHRVLAAVVAGLERRYLEAHAKAEEANERHRAALVAEIGRRADEVLGQSQSLIDDLGGKAAELVALRALLVAQGGEWNRAGIALHEHQLIPAASAIEAMKLKIRNDLMNA